MNTVNTAPSASSRKPCAVCGERIPRLALKCSHCDSFQDWRKYVGFSSTILSLLIALVSVLTVAIPVITDKVVPKRSDISVVATNLTSRTMSINEFLLLVGEQASPSTSPSTEERFEFHKLSFVATNAGNASGAITHLTIDGLNVASGFDGKREKISSFRLCDEKNLCGPITLSPKETRAFVGYGGTWKAYGPIQGLKVSVATVDISGDKSVREFKQKGIADQRGNSPDLSEWK